MGRVSLEIKTGILRHHPDEPYEAGRALDWIHPYDWSAFATFTQDRAVEIAGVDDSSDGRIRHLAKKCVLELGSTREAVWYHFDNGVLVPKRFKLICPE